MLKTQFIQKKEIDTKIDRLRAILRKDTKEAAREGAFEGTMEAKLQILANDENRKVDYSRKDMPMTTEEFDKKVRWSWFVRASILLTLFIFGFIDFSDIVSFLISPFS